MTDNKDCQDSCVCNTVKKIVHAQDKVTSKKVNCSTGCEQSIQDLLNPRPNYSNKTTIPFVLYCKETCKPFIAETVQHATMKCCGRKWYRCVKSPFLKAKQIIPGNKCCVEVEILLPCNVNGKTMHHKGNELCDFLCEENQLKTIHFRETGICLTLDLEDFNAIRCLAATTPLPQEAHHGHCHK